MNLDEYFLRNPSIVEKINSGKTNRRNWEEFFPSLESVAWSSFIFRYLAKTGSAVLHPVRTNVKYVDLTPDEYDEQMAINQKFQRIYVQEKREKSLREAAAQYDCQ